MHPEELKRLTGGAIDPIGSIKTGAKQAVVKVNEGTLKVIKAIRDIPQVTMKRGLGLLITPPEILIENEEKNRFKKINKNSFTP